MRQYHSLCGQASSGARKLSVTVKQLPYKVMALPARRHSLLWALSYMTHTSHMIIQSILLLVFRTLSVEVILVCSPPAGRGHMNFIDSLADLLIDALNIVVSFFFLWWRKYFIPECTKGQQYLSRQNSSRWKSRPLTICLYNCICECNIKRIPSPLETGFIIHLFAWKYKRSNQKSSPLLACQHSYLFASNNS